MSTNLVFSDLRDELLTLVANIGDKILRLRERGEITVTKKRDNSPVTVADNLSHEILNTQLPRMVSLPVLSEESEPIDFSIRQQWGRYWLVDPLDGTRDFLAGNSDFSVNIALIEAGKPALGVVHFPARQLSYTGGRDLPARKHSKGSSDPIGVTHIDQGAQPLRVVTSTRFSSQKLSPILSAAKTRFGDYRVRKFGGAVKSCLVAEGEADFYPCPGLTSEWDTAAAQAVVEAAGGGLFNLSGEPLRYNCKAELLNPYFYAAGDTRFDWPSLFR